MCNATRFVEPGKPKTTNISVSDCVPSSNWHHQCRHQFSGFFPRFSLRLLGIQKNSFARTVREFGLAEDPNTKFAG